MKKMLSVLCVLSMLLSLTGCGLFADNSKVVVSETFTHQDPTGLKYDERIVLKGQGFAEILEGVLSAAAYPNTIVMDENFAPIGTYLYDEQTGYASGWMRFEDGEMIMFPEGEELFLGVPDTSLMVDIEGSVDMAAIVYGNEGKAVSTSFYLLLSDPKAKDVVIPAAASVFALDFTESSEGVLVCVKDETAIAADFALDESYGMVYASKNGQAYADRLKQYYGLRVENGANPYVPYSGHADPVDLEFDSRKVLTGPGTLAVPKECSNSIKCLTDYIYAKDGIVVAQYIYFEFETAEAAQLAYESNITFNPVMLSETVLFGSIRDQEMQTALDQYIGYNLFSDKTIDTYVKYLEGAFESSIYE